MAVAALQRRADASNGIMVRDNGFWNGSMPPLTGERQKGLRHLANKVTFPTC